MSKQGEPIYLYLTGDEDGPDIFGVVYDEEDDAMEAGRENDVEVWRVPFIPQLDLAVRIESDADNA
jgi:hypothetical protein